MVDIHRILSSEKESGHIEVKTATEGVPQSMWETYSAFANTDGGVILLGVQEDVQTKKLIPIGIKNTEKMIPELWNALNNPQKISENILLNENIYTVDYDKKKIIVMEVPRAARQSRPVYIGRDMFSGSYRRNGEGDYRCKREEVLAMLRDQAEESADSKVVETLRLSDLNHESILGYRRMFSNRKPNHIWTKLSDEEFLLKTGAAKKGSDGELHPTIAGLLFFGDFVTIMDVLPNYFLDYRERKATNIRWSDRVCCSDGDWSGNIFDFYFRIIGKLTADVKKPFKLDEQMMRVDDTSIHAAIREALANALIHADYYGRQGIVIDKDFSKITISNPGTFRISIEDAIAGGVSDTRNARIFNMFSLINVGERSGSGLCDIYSTWEENGFAKPVIQELSDPARVVLTLETISVSDEARNEARNKARTQGLSEREIQMLDIIAIMPTVSAAMLSEQLKISRSTVDRMIKGLKAKEYLRHEGSTKKGTWKILK